MSRRFFKIFSLALIAVFIVLGAISAQRTTGGGGGNRDIPMIAIFSEGPISTFPEGKIRNDTPNLPYVYQGSRTGQNYLVISQPGTTGDFRMCIHGGSGRFVKFLFNDVLQPPRPVSELPSVCLHPYFIYPTIKVPVETTYIFISTARECQYIYHDDASNPWTELIPMENYLNFTTMRIGETRGVCGLGNTIRFRTKDDPATRNYNESQDEYGLVMDPQYYLVKATDWDGNNIMDWILTPICGDLKVKEADGTYSDYPYGTVLRQVVSSGQRVCDHGTYWMPFELKIARMQ
jgi:hypothetical protein